MNLLLSQSILSYYIVLVPVSVGFFAEATKILFEGILEGKWKNGLLRPGGIPSSHSAMVTSLVMVVGHKSGTMSAEFAIAFVLALFIWYDAANSRKAIGEQAKILNSLQGSIKLSERVGHSVLEVMGGIAFGIAFTAIELWFIF